MTLLAPLLVNRKGEHRELLADARKSGFVRLRIDGEIVLSEDVSTLDKRKKHHVEAVVDRIVVAPGLVSRVTGSVETALEGRRRNANHCGRGPEGPRLLREHGV